MIIKLGTYERTSDELLAVIHKDWDERAYDKKDVDRGMLGLAFGASREFLAMKNLFEEFKAGYIEALENKLVEGVSISETEIDNVLTLERLALNFAYYYKGDHFKTSERRLNSGAGVNGDAVWKNIKKRAEHAGLLAGADRCHGGRIHPTHGYHHTIQ